MVFILVYRVPKVHKDQSGYNYHVDFCDPRIIRTWYYLCGSKTILIVGQMLILFHGWCKNRMKLSGEMHI